MPAIKRAIRAAVVFLVAVFALTLALGMFGNIGPTELTIVVVIAVGVAALDAWRVSKRSVQRKA